MSTRLAGSWIGYHARVRPDHVAVTYLATGRQLSYGQFDDRVGRLAGALSRRYGVARGDRARTRLAAFKVPRDVHLVGELPRNATGKVLKAELRRRVAADGDS